MAKEKMIKVIKVEKDGLRTVVKEDLFENDLDVFQKYVGGYIEVTSAVPDGDRKGTPLHMVINEEGKFKPLKPTIGFAQGNQLIDYVAGNAVFLASNDEGDFCSLTEEEIAYLLKRYGQHGTVNIDGESHHIIVFSG